MIDIETLAVAKKYTDDSMEGAGAVAGKPCQIQSITEIPGGNRVTFLWIDNSGVEHTSTMDVMDGASGDAGLGIKSVAVNAEDHLIITYDDDTTQDAGQILVAAAVDSVNGKTGDVVLDASDVGALPDDTDIPSKTSDLTNDSIVDGASYDSANHQILFKNGSTTLFSLDAAAFVKDGMVDTVEIVDGNLVITFNTDAGKQDISIPITDIFDPNNYYNKTAMDALLGTKADQTEVNSIENYYGSKNLCIYPFYHTTRTVNGITFTDNGDGTVTATGTATDNAIFNVSNRLELGKLILPNGKYKVNGCPSGGSTNSYWMVMSRTSGGTSANYGNDTGNGMTATLNGDDFSQDNVHFQIAIVIKSGYEITTPLVFKPMVRLATIKDDTFVPYAKTNRELTLYAAGQDEVSDIGNIYGAKNLIPFPYTFKSGTYNGVDITVNNDGTLTCNGTSMAISWIGLHGVLNQSYPYLLKAGHYILTCPDAPNNTSYIQIIAQDSSLSGIQAYAGHDMEFTVATDTYVYIGFRIANGQVCDNLTIHPMLRMASVKDDTYVPYVPTNAKLNEEKMSYADNGVLGAKNLIGNPEFPQSGTYYTVQDDNSVVFNGTPSANLFFNYGFNKNNRNYSYIIPIEPGKSYIVNGCPEGGSGSGQGMPTNYAIRCYAQFSDETLQWLGADYGEGVKITVPSNAVYVFVQIAITAGTVLSDIIFRPMIRLASDPDDTYQPYAMTNKQLTNRVIQSVESITLDNTTTNAGSVKLYRYGNLRVLTGYFRPTVAGTSDANTHIADLPSSTDYPQFDVPGVCGRGAGSSTAESKIGNILALAAGSVVFQGKDVGENMFFNITWVVA